MTNSQAKKYKADIKVRFRDIDSMGHVNNAVYFTYMEIARTHLLMDLINLADPELLPIIIAEASCTYMSPARFGDFIQVTVHVSRIGTKSFELSYEMSNQENRSVAIGRTIMVAYDYKGRRTISIPENMRKSLETYRVQ